MTESSDPPVSGSVWTVLVGGGSGRRFGAPKQYEELVDGERVIDRARRMAASATDGVIVVVPAEDLDTEGDVAGGLTRSESVRNGLAALPDDDTIDVVCVHDAARPLAGPDVFDRVITAVRDGADAAVPAVPVTDTIKVVDADGRVVGTPDRDTLVAVQTPQAFRRQVLVSAHDAGADATDDAGLVEAAGGTVVVVPGHADNRKITHPDDLAWARALLADRAADGGSP